MVEAAGEAAVAVVVAARAGSGELGRSAMHQ